DHAEDEIGTACRQVIRRPIVDRHLSECAPAQSAKRQNLLGLMKVIAITAGRLTAVPLSEQRRDSRTLLSAHAGPEHGQKKKPAECNQRKMPGPSPCGEEHREQD